MPPPLVQDWPFHGWPPVGAALALVVVCCGMIAGAEAEGLPDAKLDGALNGTAELAGLLLTGEKTDAGIGIGALLDPNTGCLLETGTAEDCGAALLTGDAAADPSLVKTFRLLMVQ